MTSTTTLSPSAAHWTYADYLSLSDDERFEIYAGVLTPVPAPDLAHQRLVRNVSMALWDFVSRFRLGEVLCAPVDVVLGDRQDTVLQPDIMFVATNSRNRILRPRGVFGAPDLVIEVLSPHTAVRDRGMKRELYAAAGVREYWLLDPSDMTAERCTLNANQELASDFIVHAQGTALRDGRPVASRVLPGWRLSLEEAFAQ